jgi:hypothetical protein
MIASFETGEEPETGEGPRRRTGAGGITQRA